MIVNVQVAIPEPPPPATVDIVGLAMREAEVLLRLIGAGVIGSSFGPRAVTDELYHKLRAAGVGYDRTIVVRGNVELS